VKLLWLLTFEYHAIRVSTFEDCGYDFPAIGAKLIHPPHDDVRPCAVDMNHLDFVFRVGRHHFSGRVETRVQRRSDAVVIFGGSQSPNNPCDSLGSARFVAYRQVEVRQYSNGYLPSSRPHARNYGIPVHTAQ
jgi:hypothetical protein